MDGCGVALLVLLGLIPLSWLGVRSAGRDTQIFWVVAMSIGALVILGGSC